MKKTKTPRSKQELIDALEHVSFEMNRYLYTAHFKSIGRPLDQIVAESCLLHSRNIGEFFFQKATRDDDVTIDDYYNELILKDELQIEIDKWKPKWDNYKERINKKLSHLTFLRVNSLPMNMQEKNDLYFDILIKLFEKNLPTDFREKWNLGKSIAL